MDEQQFLRRWAAGRRCSRALIGLGILLASPAAALAGDRGNLIGTVIDSLGKPVAGVEIQILDASTGKPVASAVSTERGRYRIRCIEEGLYGVRLVPGDHDVRGRTATVSVTAEGRRLDWTVDGERPALPRPLGSGGKCNRTAIAWADDVLPRSAPPLG
jgi:hypothetical protein